MPIFIGMVCLYAFPIQISNTVVYSRAIVTSADQKATTIQVMSIVEKSWPKMLIEGDAPGPGELPLVIVLILPPSARCSINRKIVKNIEQEDMTKWRLTGHRGTSAIFLFTCSTLKDLSHRFVIVFVADASHKLA